MGAGAGSGSREDGGDGDGGGGDGGRGGVEGWTNPDTDPDTGVILIRDHLGGVDGSSVDGGADEGDGGF